MPSRGDQSIHRFEAAIHVVQQTTWTGMLRCAPGRRRTVRERDYLGTAAGLTESRYL